MRDLTDKQRRVLKLIRVSIRVRGQAPTVRELMRALGLSAPDSVCNHLRALRRKGFILITPRAPRGIALTGKTEGQLTGKRSLMPLGSVVKLLRPPKHEAEPRVGSSR